MSATATPGLTEGQVSTDGSWGKRRMRETHREEGGMRMAESEKEHIPLLTALSNDTELMTMK